MDRGKTIRARICRREHPSAMALSSISLGIVRKYPIRSQEANGMS